MRMMRARKKGNCGFYFSVSIYYILYIKTYLQKCVALPEKEPLMNVWIDRVVVRGGGEGRQSRDCGPSGDQDGGGGYGVRTTSSSHRCVIVIVVVGAPSRHWLRRGATMRHCHRCIPSLSSLSSVLCHRVDTLVVVALLPRRHVCCTAWTVDEAWQRVCEGPRSEGEEDGEASTHVVAFVVFDVARDARIRMSPSMMLR